MASRVISRSRRSLFRLGDRSSGPSPREGRMQETKASILSSGSGASEAGATDATWQCSGHRLATRPRQTVAAPPRFHDNSLETNTTQQRHLPRQEKARSCPAPLMHSKAGRRAGMDPPALGRPLPSRPSQGSPLLAFKVPPRTGEEPRARPLCLLQAELVEVFLLRRADISSFPPPRPMHRQPGRAWAAQLNPKCAAKERRLGARGGAPEPSTCWRSPRRGWRAPDPGAAPSSAARDTTLPIGQ